jgi:beta-glucosidase/6-phospho-beta-glucosidase/beta-galactosidase
MVTLYHWDLPLYLQNAYGGWLSNDIVDDFTEYARVVFTRWSSKVHYWFTVNEPIVFCGFYPLPEHYFKATTIPDVQQPYWCGHHVLLAHSAAYRLAKSINGSLSVSFKNNGGYKIPRTDSAEDAVAVRRAWAFNEAWFADPIFLTGDYPSLLKDYVSTFLPAFTEDQKKQINGSGDIFAHDAYTSDFYMAPDTGVDACVGNSSHSLFPGCFNTTKLYANDYWLIGSASDPGTPWLNKATDWVPAFLRYMQDTWKPRVSVDCLNEWCCANDSV